jgi:hypothetical protein
LCSSPGTTPDNSPRRWRTLLGHTPSTGTCHRRDLRWRPNLLPRGLPFSPRRRFWLDADGETNKGRRVRQLDTYVVRRGGKKKRDRVPALRPWRYGCYGCARDYQVDPTRRWPSAAAGWVVGLTESRPQYRARCSPGNDPSELRVGSSVARAWFRGDDGSDILAPHARHTRCERNPIQWGSAAAAQCTWEAGELGPPIGACSPQLGRAGWSLEMGWKVRIEPSQDLFHFSFSFLSSSKFKFQVWIHTCCEVHT